ncbi:MAG TPA: hypothetical protein VK932_09195 [Kofleriaceae bacterium]|nr:hypothetical protein [Kofleriaceae bacterium]
MRRLPEIALGAAALVASLAPPARADRHEASISIRPTGQLAWIAERGAGDRAVVPGGGLTGGLHVGVRNWLDLGGELAAAAFGGATYAAAMLPIDGNPRTGVLSRHTRTLQLRGVATLRLGVGWVPTIQLAAGAGARQRSEAQLRTRASGSELVLVPDGEGEELALDLVAALRVGLERRLTPRWTIGASVGAAHCLGVGTPDMQLADATFSLSYNWYHLWW